MSSSADTNNLTSHIPPSMRRLLSPESFSFAPSLLSHAESTLLGPASASPTSPRLATALNSPAAAGLPPISTRPLAARHLALLARVSGAKSVLEVGTLAGYGAIAIAEGSGARVVTIEKDPRCAEVARGNVKGLDIEVVEGDAVGVMQGMVSEGKEGGFDMVFIDADIDAELQWKVFDLAVKLARREDGRGFVVLDDVVPGMIRDGFGEEEGEGKGEGEEETILTRIGRDERVEATLVPTVVCHPDIPSPVFNGYVLARVK